MYCFVVYKRLKAIFELAKTTLRIHSFSEIVLSVKTERIDTVKPSLFSDECVLEFQLEWLKSSKEVLKQKDFNAYIFAVALRDPIIKGAKKDNSIILVGPASYGNSSILNLFELLFEIFVNPGNGKYTWVELDKCERVFLN